MWLIAVAWAEPCNGPVPGVREQLDAAWAQYNDAEVAAAEAIVGQTIASLPCQALVVPTDDLLDLYRLDALVSLSSNDTEGAVYATLRAVAVRHEGAVPPDGYGPYLIDLYQTWSVRLGGALVAVSVDGGGEVWVDGRPVQGPLAVAQGEHLIQVGDGHTVRSTVVDLRADHRVVTGLPGPAPVGSDPIGVGGPAEPVGGPADPPPAEPPLADPPQALGAGSSPRRRRPLWAVAGAGIAGGGAAFLLASGSVSERNFKTDPYRGLGATRADNIARDARAIRVAYGAGYGLAALSGGLLTVVAVGLPTAGGPTVGWRFVW